MPLLRLLAGRLLPAEVKAWVVYVCVCVYMCVCVRVCVRVRLPASTKQSLGGWGEEGPAGKVCVGRGGALGHPS